MRNAGEPPGVLSLGLLAAVEQGGDIGFRFNPVANGIALELVAFRTVVGGFGNHAITLRVADDHGLPGTLGG